MATGLIPVDQVEPGDVLVVSRVDPDTYRIKHRLHAVMHITLARGGDVAIGFVGLADTVPYSKDEQVVRLDATNEPDEHLTGWGDPQNLIRHLREGHGVAWRYIGSDERGLAEIHAAEHKGDS